MSNLKEDEDPRLKLCVVFDIDETLIHFINKNKIRNTNWDKMLPEEKAQFEHIVNEGGHLIFIRPYLISLFRWFKARNIEVGLWTWSETDYAENIASLIKKECKRQGEFDFDFLFAWGDTEMDDAADYGGGSKSLARVWSKHPHLNKFNTIIVDDEPGNIKHKANKQNCILIQPYAPFGRRKARTHMTDELKKLALEDNALNELQHVCEAVIDDIEGCTREDIDGSFETQAVFDPERVRRMKDNNSLNLNMIKYANTFVTLPTIGKSHQHDNFMDVTEMSDRIGPEVHGGTRRRVRSRPRKTKRRPRKTRSKRGGNTDQEKKDKTFLEAVKGTKVSLHQTKFDEVKKALDAGADVNAKDERNRTALYWASKKGYTKIVAMLLEKGADVNAKDKDGYTALKMASHNGHTKTADLIKKYIETKNQRKNVMGDLEKYNRPNISSLSTMAYQSVPTDVDTIFNKRSMDRPFGTLGGKRKTQKSGK